MATLNKRLKFIRTSLALWASDLFSGRAGVVTDSVPDSVERWGWNDSGTWKYSARSGANETFSGIKNTSLTVNKLIRHTATGEADSCFSDDGSTAAISRPLALNGATRPAWVANLARTVQLSDAVALGVYSDVETDGAELWANLSYSSGYTAINGKAGNLPTGLSISRGAITLISSITQPTPGGAVSDITAKWSVDKYGRQTQWASEPVVSGNWWSARSTLTNSTAETTLIGGAKTISAYRLNNAGTLINTVLWCAATSSGSPTFTVRVYLGSTVIGSATLTLANLTGTGFRIEVQMLVESVGTGGVMTMYGVCWWISSSGQGTAPLAFNLSPILGDIAINTTVDNTINITGQWSAASTGNIFKASSRALIA